MSFLKQFRKDKPEQRPIIIVSGLPRSGTSMMMKMLEAGGIPPLTDALRVADVDNPEGYYEYERVKKLPEGDVGWLPEGCGKTVKVISQLLRYLPPEHRYQVIFMRRDIAEVLTSQKTMLIHRHQPTDRVSDEELARLYEQHLSHVDAWLAGQPNILLLNVDYKSLLTEPQRQIANISHFLGSNLDVDRMAEVIDPSLYRNRGQMPSAAPGR